MTLQYLENIYTMFSSEPVTSKEAKNRYQTFLKRLGIVSCLRRMLFLLLTAPMISQALDNQHLRHPAKETSLVKKSKKWQLWISDDG